MAESFGPAMPMPDAHPARVAVQNGEPEERQAPEPIRVLVVDDHELFRRGLEIVLAQEEDIQVIGEAGDGAEAVDKAADLLPDIVLMDVRMPKRGGIEACTPSRKWPPARRSSC